MVKMKMKKKTMGQKILPSKINLSPSLSGSVKLVSFPQHSSSSLLLLDLYSTSGPSDLVISLTSRTSPILLELSS